VAGTSLYTATTELLTNELPDWGVEVDLVDPADPDAFAEKSRDRTRLFYVETPSNPTMMLTDLAALSAVARARGIVTVVDNTFRHALATSGRWPWAPTW